MKKYLILILCGVLLFTGCGKKEEELSPEKKAEQKFLHDLKDEGITERKIYVDGKEKSYQCDALDKNIIYYDGNVLLTADHDLYKISSSLYSNDTNCKKVPEDLKVKFVLSSNSFIGENNVTYQFNDDSEKGYSENNYYEFQKFLVSYYEKQKVSFWNTTSANNIEGIDTSYSDNKDNSNGYVSSYYAGAAYALRDGNIYVDAFKRVTTYNYSSSKSTTSYVLLNSKLIYKASDFDGEIVGIYPDNQSAYSVKNQLSIIIKTSSGYYWLVATNKEECEKYEDVSCLYEMRSSDFLATYYERFKYIGNGYLIGTNGKIYSLPYSR